VAPAKTPPESVQKISDAMNEGLTKLEIQKTIAVLGSEAKPNSPAEFATYIAEQHRKWVAVGKAAHVEVD
jgi:tripartite-type tricarboxylate transporter receptor subunit TctC